MGDARVGEHALHVFLDQGSEVPDRHGQHRDPGDDRGRGMRQQEQDELEQEREARRLGARRHERGHRGRAALVDVGDPQVEGDHADLEEQARDHQADACRGRGSRRCPFRARSGRDSVPPLPCRSARRRTGRMRGGERAQHEVLQSGFDGYVAALRLEGREAVEGDREQLESDEEHDRGLRPRPSASCRSACRASGRRALRGRCGWLL